MSDSLFPAQQTPEQIAERPADAVRTGFQSSANGVQEFDG